MAKKILVVDDDQTNVKIVQSRLEATGYQVVVALDGDEGLLKAKLEKPDLIILDIQMPRMNGYTFINELKKIQTLKSTPVIVLTAHETMQPIFSLKGVKGYLVKPLNINILLEKMTQVLTPSNSNPS